MYFLPFASVRPAWDFAIKAAVRGNGGGRKKSQSVEFSGILPLRDEQIAVWLGVGSICHVLICDADANVDLCINFLQVFASVLADHMKGGALELFLGRHIFLSLAG